MEDLDGHFENLKIVNFNIVNSKGKLSESKMKQYQKVNHSEILTYPQHNQDEILSSMFRIKRNSMHVKKSINEHFKNPLNLMDMAVLLKRIRIFIIKSDGRNCYFLIFFL